MKKRERFTQSQHMHIVIDGTRTMLVAVCCSCYCSKQCPYGRRSLRLRCHGGRDHGCSNFQKHVHGRFESLGASFEGSADADGTIFNLSVPAANFAEASDLAARILKGALFPSEELDRERMRRTQRLLVRRSEPSMPIRSPRSS